MPTTIPEQLAYLFILAIPIACIAWTVTHEEVFREPRNTVSSGVRTATRLCRVSSFTLFTCEYCFSHYVTMFFLLITQFRLLYSDWRGYLISGFALVWVANIYMNIYAHVRLDIKRERTEIEATERSMTH